MPIIEMLKPVTDRLDGIEGSVLSLFGAQKAAMEIMDIKSKKQRLFNYFVFLWLLIITLILIIK
jgi:hypothetical protein